MVKAIQAASAPAIRRGGVRGRSQPGCWRGRHGLGEGDDFREAFFTAPEATLDELGVEVAEVGDGASERKETETQKGSEDFGGCAGSGGRVGRGVGHG